MTADMTADITTEMTDYEKMRAAEHEDLCRQTATLILIPSRICRFRPCRRNGVCSSAMVPSSHQARQVEIHRMIGLSGRACADLPACAAALDAGQYQAFRQAMAVFKQDFRSDRTVDPWSVIRWRMAHRRSRPLTSAPDHPTSQSKTGDDAP